MGEWNGWSAVRHLEVSYDGGVVHDGPEVSYSGMRALRKQKGGLLPRFLRETLAQPPAGDHALTSGGGALFLPASVHA